MNDEVYLWHADKHRNLLQVDTIHFGCVQPGMPKIPKIRSLDIFAISPEKHAGGGGAKMIFCELMKTKVLYKLIVLLWVCVDKNICNISKKT